MNLFERQALAKAVGMSLTDLSKVVAKEKESVTLAGELAKQDLSKLIPEESMSEIAETINELKAFGLTLIEEYGPDLMEIFTSLAGPLMSMVETFASIVTYLDETVGIANILKGVMVGMIAKAVATAVVHFATAYFKSAGTMGPMGLALLAAAPAAIAGIATLIGGYAMAGDVVSPAKGKTQISTKEGELFELSKNDDLLAGPGIAARGAMAGGGMSIPNFSTKKLEDENMAIREEMTNLRKDMRRYFDTGGTVYSQVRGTNATLSAAATGG
jgi:hypothetical protein